MPTLRHNWVVNMHCKLAIEESKGAIKNGEFRNIEHMTQNEDRSMTSTMNYILDSTQGRRKT